MTTSSPYVGASHKTQSEKLESQHQDCVFPLSAHSSTLQEKNQCVLEDRWFYVLEEKKKNTDEYRWIWGIQLFPENKSSLQDISVLKGGGSLEHLPLAKFWSSNIKRKEDKEEERKNIRFIRTK